MTTKQLAELFGRRVAKYQHEYLMGVDLGAPGGDTTVTGYWEDGVFHIVAIDRPDPAIIEGTAVVVEKRPERLLDAGGSES
jgi:hypothetical protein